MAIENCVENENVANDNFRLLEDKINELIEFYNSQGEDIDGMQPLSFLSDSTIFTGTECEEKEYEEIQDVCVEHLVDLAQRDDFINCILSEQSKEIDILSDRIAAIQASCCYGSEDVYDPIEELVV